MGYWSNVARRAAGRAAKDTRLDTVVGAIIGVTSQAIIGLGIYVALGQTDVNLWTRCITALAPFFTYPLAFAIRMLTEQSAIWRTDQETIAELRNALDLSEKRRAIRLEFAQFIQEGEALMGRCRDPEDDSLHDEADVWATRVEQRMVELLDASYIPRFRSATGTPSNVIVGPGSDEHGGYWSGIRNRVFRLQEFIREMVAPNAHHPSVL